METRTKGLHQDTLVQYPFYKKLVPMRSNMNVYTLKIKFSKAKLHLILKFKSGNPVPDLESNMVLNPDPQHLSGLLIPTTVRRQFLDVVRGSHQFCSVSKTLSL